MSKQRSLRADYAVYLLVRVVVCILQALSPTAARTVASWLAALAYRVDRRHRMVADENLRAAFPGQYTDPERDQLVRAVYRHFCLLLVEIVQLPRKLHVSTWRRYFELADGQVIKAVLSGRPLLLVTGHFGNWELGGYAFGLLGFRPFAVARPIDNPYIDQYLRRFRESTGQGILAKKGDFDRMQGILAGGGVLATLADQDAGQRGLFVEYFGRPASTHKAVAILTLDHQVPVLVIGVQRVAESMSYRLIVEEVILPEDFTDRPDAVRALTQRFTSALERLVRRAPEQYFWLHRRWKHRPVEKKTKRVA